MMGTAQIAQSSRQQGIALISVLLVFALATVIASEIIVRNALDIRKTANYLNSQQAYYYALSGEAYGQQILHRDFMEASAQGVAADTLSDEWALLKSGFEIENGTMTIAIVDLSGRFNLNRLVGADGTIDAVAVSTFSSLVSALGIPRNYTPALTDWLDADGFEVPGGAEDSRYSGEGYLTANRPLADLSELRLLAGFDQNDYAVLKDYVVALPVDSDNGAGTYNINTLDAKLIKALVPAISAAELEKIDAIQRRGGFTSLANWIGSDVGSVLETLSPRLAVSSEYFEIAVTVTFAGRSARLTTQLYRTAKDGELRVLKRQQLRD
ncbi:MAG: general secretion pathway protein K [Paraglaciecola psychrophila]|jgi:general secretion pathway protein K